MTRKNNLRLRNMLQNALILLLTASALFLFLKTGLVRTGDLRHMFSSVSQAAVPSDSAGANWQFPLQIAVRSGGECRAWLDQTTTGDIFEDVGPLLTEALGSANGVTAVDEEEFRRALENNSIYYDFKTALPLSLLAQTLGSDESPHVSARALLLSSLQDTTAALYAWNPEENTYKIEPEQAETVQMIYDMCCDGMGYLQISKELERRKRKDGAGNVSWCSSKIGRILHNKTYAGYKGYRKSYTTDYLDHDRAKNLDRESYQYVKGNWEPIISEEQWNRVQKICADKTKTVGDHTMGKKPTDNVWLNKLRCSCAAHSKYRKNKWRTNKNTGETVFGYQCYSQLNKGSYKFRKENGLPTEGYCNISMIGEWKLELMAKILLQMLWTDRTGAIQEAVDMIRECYTEDNQTDNRKEQLAVQSQVDKYTKRLGNLLELRVDGEISKDEYQRMKAETEEKIATYKMQLLQFDQETDILPDIESQISQMEETLKQYIDFSDKNVPREILEKLLVQVIPCQNHRFVWIFNLLDKENEMLCSMDGRKNAPIFSWFEESPTLFSTQHRLLLLISRIRLY